VRVVHVGSVHVKNTPR